MTPSSTNKKRKSKIPFVFIAGGASVLAIAAGLLLRTPTPASATPSFLGLAESQYPSIVGSRIDSCNLCHVPNAIPSLNAYGTAFLNNGLNAAALVAIENLDSDGDGFTNIQEIRALTFPGDPIDHPQAASPTPTRTATTVPTTVPSSTPTRVPTVVPTTVPSSTPTRVPTVVPTTVPSSTPTRVPTVVPTTLPSNTPTATATLPPIATGTVGPTQTATATLTPIASGTVGPTPTVQCQNDDERNEHFKKSHGKSKEQVAAAEEANEEKLCKEHENEGSEINEGHENEANEIEEANESEQTEMHENENEANESGQAELGEQDNQGQQDSEGHQESLGNDQSFINTVDVWLSQWFINTDFHN